MTSPTPPRPVRWPVMYQTWSWLSFLHWSYEPRVLERLLPDRLRPHTFDGRAWVGATPFLLQDLRTPVAPALPWFTSFPETNVRTYVVGPDGREGHWFFSLDAARLEPVLVARSTYALPYKWSAMTVARDGPVIRCRSRSRWPGRRPASAAVTVDVGDPLAPEEVGEFDHYLTARWQLYTTLGPVLARSTVEHEPWPLHRAVVPELDSNLVTVAGLPARRASRWCTGRQGCGPGSAPYARSGGANGNLTRSSCHPRGPKPAARAQTLRAARFWPEAPDELLNGAPLQLYIDGLVERWDEPIVGGQGHGRGRHLSSRGERRGVRRASNCSGSP